jgi:catechol 2,3-dioxygenase-like lactoylglutathione lyase family enzyme
VIRRIDHTTITVTDIKRSVEFYTGLLGFTVDHEMFLSESHLHIVFLRLGDSVLEIFDVPRVEGAVMSDVNEIVGYKHICLLVDSVDAEHARLSQAGVKFRLEPSDVQNVRVAFLKDPDGMDIELLEYLSEE